MVVRRFSFVLAEVYCVVFVFFSPNFDFICSSLAKRLARKSVPKIISLVSSGKLNFNSISITKFNGATFYSLLFGYVFDTLQMARL